MTEKTARPAPPEQPEAVAAQERPAVPVVATPGRGLSAPMVILQLALLYLLPISLIVLFGRLVLGL